jgi:O-antigen/teichoic acid export membrane protein
MRRALSDPATLIAIGYRVSPAVTGLLAIFLVARHYSLEQQAFYYMAVNFFGILQLSDLGLSVVLIQFSSHEWSRIAPQPDGGLVGDPDAIARLHSLVAQARLWYGALSALYLLLAGGAGFYVFGSRLPELAWQGPWCVLAVLFALTLYMTHRMAVLEGCGHVREVYAARLIWGTAGFAALAAGILLGWGLWSICLNYAVFVIVLFYVTQYRYGPFFRRLSATHGARIDWWREVWPLQWSFSLNAAVGYFLFQIYVPIIMLIVGSAAAGRAGMTVQMTNFVGSIGAAVITVRVPAFGGLIAQRKFAELDRLFYRTSAAAFLLSVAAALAFIAGVWAVNAYRLPVADRMLPPDETLLFLLAILAGVPSQCFGYYLIAHKKNPMMVLGLVAGIVNLAMVVVLVKLLGTYGAGLSVLLLNCFLVVPWHFAIWRRCRRLWHVATPGPLAGEPRA